MKNTCFFSLASLFVLKSLSGKVKGRKGERHQYQSTDGTVYSWLQLMTNQHIFGWLIQLTVNWAHIWKVMVQHP